MTVHRVDHVEPVQVSSPAGFLPALPGEARVVATDGVVTTKSPVTWDRGEVSRYAAPGTVSVRGTVAGTSQLAEATVQVVDPAAEENVARSTSRTKPTADAGFSGADDHAAGGDARRHDRERGLVDPISTSRPPRCSRLVSARTRASGSRWTGRRAGVHRHGPAYFTLNANRQLPRDIVLSYWDGSRYVPVRDQQVTWATSSDQSTRITFDPVATTSLRVDMTSKSPWTSTGFLQISELEVSGRPDRLTCGNDGGADPVRSAPPSCALELGPGLLEHGAQLLLHLVEVLLAADQRRRRAG